MISSITGTTALFGVIGNPISHSYSPIMHNAAFQNLGLNAVYVPLEVPLDKVSEALVGLHTVHFIGVNVTIPFKEIIVPYIGKLSKRATIVGSVNTLHWTENRYHGYNTDGEGFKRSLDEDIAFSLEGAHVVIIGAGGAAKAVATECAMGGVKSITLAGRNEKKLTELAYRIQQFFPTIRLDIIGPDLTPLSSYVKKADLLVNATPVGMKPGDSTPIPADWLHSKLSVIDLIYNPSVTTLLAAAKDRGCPCTNGMTMLIAQGAASFKIWLNVMPPLAVMRTAIENHLNRVHKN